MKAQTAPLSVFAQSWANDSCGCTGFRSHSVSYDASTNSTLIAGLTFEGVDFLTINSVFGKADIYHQVNETTFVCCYTLYDYEQCGDVSKGWKNLKFTFVDGVVSAIDVVYLTHDYNGTAMVNERDGLSM
jgi:hypothetical protein